MRRLNHCNLPHPPGVDFKIKPVIVNGKRVNLTIWDTAGQERFRTLTSSYYRGASGIILVYDVTRRETLTSVVDGWMAEVQRYSTLPGCALMLVGNKADREADREVGKEVGAELARSWGCLFLECSAKTRHNVQQCFSELVHKVGEEAGEQRRRGGGACCCMFQALGRGEGVYWWFFHAAR
ncbi:unnamed protein product [Closterium sp. Naga37s-1]|nr:unnamed protein product [Closterium sp. Naga37s-1]